MIMRPRVRFAPSPTGHLHIGTARTALFNYLFARHEGGKFILRMEDTDLPRSRRQFEESICEDLRWLGLNWDEGPDLGGLFGPYRQSEREKLYQEETKRLLREGKAYYCFCTQEELERRRKEAFLAGKAPRYDRRCLNLSQEEKKKLLKEGKKAAVRFRIPAGKIKFKDLIKGWVEFNSEIFGDFIVLRSDGRPSYHLAVVVDDAKMAITHVIRGEDHLTNTVCHILLFQALGYPLPLFAHLPMILGEDGSKLSKRHGATSINEYRKQGYLPEAIVNYLALLGWSPKKKEVVNLNNLIEDFSLERVSKSPSIFNLSKLKWLNREHLKLKENKEILKLAFPYLIAEGIIKDKFNKKKMLQAIEAVKLNLELLSDVPSYVKIFFKEASLSKEVLGFLKNPNSIKVLEELKETLPAKEISFTEAKDFLRKFKEKFKNKGLTTRDVFLPIRIALTGESSGVELFYLISILGHDESLKRVERVLSQVREIK